MASLPHALPDFKLGTMCHPVNGIPRPGKLTRQAAAGSSGPAP
jgi:hypothetical protein